MTMRFGPAGLGSLKEAAGNLEMYHKLGLKACEIAFTYGIYIKEEKIARDIGKKAMELDIRLSIHSPYWINLNSQEKKKVEESKKRILDCCKIGEMLGAYRVVFHPGYYGKMDKLESYENIRDRIIELEKEIERNKWKIQIAPETTGKVNVFGSVEEIHNLVKDTGCSFAVDFAHLYARSNGKLEYGEMAENFAKYKNWHCHFSGIEFSSKGERNHKITPETEIKKLLAVMPKDKDIVIINESPTPVEDAVKMMKIWEKLN